MTRQVLPMPFVVIGALLMGCADLTRDSESDIRNDPRRTRPAELYVRLDIRDDARFDPLSLEQRAAILGDHRLSIAGRTHDGSVLDGSIGGRVDEVADFDHEGFTHLAVPGGQYIVTLQPGVTPAASVLTEPDAQRVELDPGDRESLVFRFDRRTLHVSGTARLTSVDEVPDEARIHIGRVDTRHGERCQPGERLADAIEPGVDGRWSTELAMPVADVVCVWATAPGHGTASRYVELPAERPAAVEVPPLELAPQPVSLTVFASSPLDGAPFAGPERGDAATAARLVLLHVEAPPGLSFGGRGCDDPPCVAIEAVAATDVVVGPEPRVPPPRPLEWILDAPPTVGEISAETCADVDDRSLFALENAPAISPPLGIGDDGQSLRALYCLRASGVGPRLLHVELLGDDGIMRWGVGRIELVRDPPPDLTVGVRDAVVSEARRFVDGGEQGEVELILDIETSATVGWCTRVAVGAPDQRCEVTLDAANTRCVGGAERPTRLEATAPPTPEGVYDEAPARICVELRDRAGQMVQQTVDVTRVINRPRVEFRGGGLIGWLDEDCSAMPDACPRQDARRTTGLVVVHAVDNTDFAAGGAVSALRIEVGRPRLDAADAELDPPIEVPFVPRADLGESTMVIPLELGPRDGLVQVRITAIDRLGRPADGARADQHFIVDTHPPAFDALRILGCGACERREVDNDIDRARADAAACIERACHRCIDETFFLPDGRPILPPIALDLPLHVRQAPTPLGAPDAICGRFTTAGIADAVVRNLGLCFDGASELSLASAPPADRPELAPQIIQGEATDQACLVTPTEPIELLRDRTAPQVTRRNGDIDARLAVELECLEFRSLCHPLREPSESILVRSAGACGREGPTCDAGVGDDRPSIIGRLSFTVTDEGNEALGQAIRARVLAVETTLDPLRSTWGGDDDRPLCNQDVHFAAAGETRRRAACPGPASGCVCVTPEVPTDVDFSALEVRRTADNGRIRWQAVNPCTPGSRPVDVRLYVALEDAVGNRRLESLSDRTHRVFVVTDDGDAAGCRRTFKPHWCSAPTDEERPELNPPDHCRIVEAP